MRKFLVVAAMLVSVSAFSQDPVSKYLEKRFGGPDSQTFIPKGSHALGIKGGYRSFSAQGDDATNSGYALLSLLNIGDGFLRVWNVSPSYSHFLADDFSLGVALNYNGYAADTDLRLDLRDVLNASGDKLNLSIIQRSLRHHAVGVSLVARKYMPLFGSKHFAIFGEGRLQGSYGATSNVPRDGGDVNRDRLSEVFAIALKAGGGLAFKLGDNALTVSLPLFGVSYNHTIQNRTTTTTQTDDQGHETTVTTKSKTHMSSFNAARNLDLLGVQIGFVRYFGPKK